MKTGQKEHQEGLLAPSQSQKIKGNSMRLTKYLNESRLDDITEQTGEALKLIEDNCAPYLRELQKIGNPHSLLYSGRGHIDDIYIHKRVRQNRKPTDTSIEVHNLFDDYFEDKFGVRFRSNSMFTTPSIEDADSYGEPYIIFPVGKYNYL